MGRATRLLLARTLVAVPATTAMAMTFVYEGFLGAAGLSADGTFKYVFREYDNADPDVGQWVDQLLVQDGRFTVPLSFGSEIWDSETVWSESKVGRSAPT